MRLRHGRSPVRQLADRMTTTLSTRQAKIVRNFLAESSSIWRNSRRLAPASAAPARADHP
jgi:hypothetical protein